MATNAVLAKAHILYEQAGNALTEIDRRYDHLQKLGLNKKEISQEMKLFSKQKAKELRRLARIARL